MEKYFILAQSKTTAKALVVWRRLLSGKRYGNLPSIEEDETIILPSLLNLSDSGNIQTYLDVVSLIEKLLKQNDFSPTRMFVLVDQIDCAKLNPTTDGKTWEKLVAMLILTFPEIYWLFGILNSAKGFPVKDHTIGAGFTPSSPPLCDPTGLRNFIRSRIKSEAKKQNRQTYEYVPLRPKLAVALDDEKSYAYLHAYTAYRFGFRAVPAYSYHTAYYYLNPEGGVKKRIIGWHWCLRTFILIFRIPLGETFLNFTTKKAPGIQ